MASTLFLRKKEEKIRAKAQDDLQPSKGVALKGIDALQGSNIHPWFWLLRELY